MKNLLKALILASAALTCAASAADGVSLVINVASYHINPDREFNQKNPGVGLEYKKGDFTYAIGEYKNSVWKHSNYATVAYTPYKLGSFSFGGMVGLVSGYPALNNGKLGPMAAAVVQYEGFLGANLNLIVLPPVDSPVTLGLQLKYKF